MYSDPILSTKSNTYLCLNGVMTIGYGVNHVVLCGGIEWIQWAKQLQFTSVTTECELIGCFGIT